MLEIRRRTFSQVSREKGFDALLAEYAQECGIQGLPEPAPRFETYRMLDTSTMFFGLGAYLDDKLIGFAAVLAPLMPHYGRSIATMESIFVTRAYRRKTGAGMALLREAQEIAREIGSPAIMISAPTESPLERVLPKLGFRATNTVFMRTL